MISFFNAFLLFQAFVKLFWYMRVNSKIGTLINLVAVSATDAMPFMIFLFAWIMLFSLEFQIVGAEFSDEDYDGFTWKKIYAIQTYRNSIGDISTPGYSKWLTAAEDAHASSWMMIYSVWFIWLMNQYLVLIILLNFLIAVISSSYETVMGNELIHEYDAKVAFNRECRLILKAFNLQKKFDMVLLSCEKENSEEGEINEMAH